MDFLTWGRNPWGQDILIRISYTLLYLSALVGVLFMLAHIVWVRAFAKTSKPSPEDAARQKALESTLPKEVKRHSMGARAFHWIMAASMFALLITGFFPIVGIRFGWVTIHWISGVILTVSIVYHIIHASFWLDFWSIWIDKVDVREGLKRLTRAMGGTAPEPLKHGKYPIDNKMYHLAVTVAGFAVIGTGLLMLFRISTPLVTRNPYILSDQTWGWMYVLHGLAGVGTVALTMAHVYFAVRPEKLWITKSMIFGTIDRQHYVEHHDPNRWVVERETPAPKPTPERKRMTA